MSISNKFFINFLIVLLLGSLSFATNIKPVDKQSNIEKDIKNFITVSAVPSATSEILVKIQKISNILEKKRSIIEIHTNLIPFIKSIDNIIKEYDKNHLNSFTIKELRKQENEWMSLILQLKKWEKILKNRIEVFDKNSLEFENYSKLWTQTYINANAKLVPEAILNNISDVIGHIEELRDKSKKQYDLIITDLYTINTNSLTLQVKIDANSEMQKEISSKVFYKNEFSLLTIFNISKISIFSYFNSSFHSINEQMNEFIIYYKNKEILLFFILSIIIIIFVVVFNYLYKVRKLFVFESSYNKKEFFFILLPISTSLLLIMLFNVFMFNDISDTAKQFQRLIILIPIFRIFQKLMDRSLLKYLSIFFILFTLAIIEKNAIGLDLNARLFSISLSLGLIFFLKSLIINRVFNRITNKSFIVNNIYKLLIITILLLIVSIGADIYGATLLATYITNGIFTSLYASIVFYTLTVILAGYTIILLRRRMATASFMVAKYASDVEKALTIFIKLFMGLWWMIIVLKTIGLYPHIVDIKNRILELSWMVGDTTISVESIFDFFSIIIITWFIAKFIRMILEVEIFSRFKLPRGFPTAITTVLNYIIVIGGTFIAFSSLGITTEQFTLVFGALGVGIGFGIRNIIANFISGIIMVFERPVQIGDTIEINNSMGTVQGIGTRSSTIKTFDGSEIIIPNADFIAKEITNWTLSDERRRKTIVFKVALDSDIEEVLAIMNRVATSHPDTLKDPKPVSTLLNFSEYYLEFKLYFWLNSNLIVAPSNITISIYKALKEANIKMPLPKQEFINYK